MDEKQSFTGDTIPIPSQQPRRRRSKPFMIIGILLCVALLHLQPFPNSRLSSHSKLCHATRLDYAGERISWEVCGDLSGRPLECSSIDVPMDQFSAENSGNKTFSIPLIRSRGKNAAQNLLLNPGGPGGSGINFMYRLGDRLRTIVGEDFHLLSFDPRGINGSRPLATCYPDKEARRELSPVRDGKVVEDSPELYAWAQNFVKACAETMGEHGKYINTPQTAADMNSILDAVGQDDMVYWGFSYGTILGQTYAGIFPERSKRVIIDGVANQFDWYQGLLDAEVMVDTENVFDGFLDECVKAGENCTLASLAPSKNDLLAKIMALAANLDEQPQSVYVNNSVYGLLSYKKLMYDAIFPTLYKPANWYTLADNLAKWLQGNATEAFLAYGGAPWDIAGDAESVVTLNDGASGVDHWPQDRQALLEMLLPFMNQSIFSPAEYAGYYPKQKWIIPKTHDFVPRMGVKTAHPLLILSTTYDPVCPLVSARSANAAFEGSQIVEVRGYGHCSLAIPSTCIAKHVRAFLTNGTLPEKYTQCESDGPYFIKPEEDGKVVALKHFDDEEERDIHMAQLYLARDWTLPRWS
ncbi:Alpha/Beta hydrolase protein [Hypoxylon rubiginosum]|uniref:Alpha/Beta hydrolase protein n=1 Tax=Hypoxylon rubiginosum TaxID=110542 RepID=A0ACB9YSP9_9PEZI|nr:Alpha/Beta hydrolase protein [Hypoxylon rubiginosum]